MLRLLLSLCLLSSCHDKCEENGGYWEHFNCHPYTYYVTNCVVYDRHGNCVQSMMVPVNEQRCDKRCVMPEKR